MASLAGRSRSTAAWATATAFALCLAQVPLALAAPPDAAAESTTVKAAILPLVVEGEMPESDAATLTTQLVEGLQRGSFAVVTPDQVGAVSGGDCSKPSCMGKIAESTGANYIVRAVVNVSDRDYKVNVELYDSGGAKIVSSSDGCEICGVVDVGALLDTQAATLSTKLEALMSGPATVHIVSTPDGAEVTLDGEPFGVTPIDSKTILPGDHTIRVSKDGYIAVQEKRTFVQGVVESLSYELDKTPNRLPKRPYGWVSLAFGIAAVGGSVGLTFLHDRPYKLGGACTGANVDSDGDCAKLFNTKWYGMALGLAGGALVTLGVAILINTAKGPTKKAKIEAAAKRLQVGPAGVGLRF